MATNCNVYRCDYCNKYFETIENAEQCESKHLKNPRIYRISYDDEDRLNCSRNIMVPKSIIVDFDYPKEYYPMAAKYLLRVTYRHDFSREDFSTIQI